MTFLNSCHSLQSKVSFSSSQLPLQITAKHSFHPAHSLLLTQVTSNSSLLHPYEAVHAITDLLDKNIQQHLFGPDICKKMLIYVQVSVFSYGYIDDEASIESSTDTVTASLSGDRSADSITVRDHDSVV